MHRQSTTEESCALVVDTRDTQRQTQSSMRAILPSPNGDHLVKNCPLKWFSLAVFDGHLLAIGGKVSGSRKEDSNKIASWEEEMME